jgi:hypothetical protein
MKKSSLSLLFVFFASILVAGSAAAQSPPPGAVLTYHNDNFRTGWQQQETMLNSSNVSSATFKILQTVTLTGVPGVSGGDQVDAQPLVVSGLAINGGKDIVIVADESNNVYEIDPTSGTILNAKRLGSPVPKPLNCGNNGPNVGITGTPVIDWASQTLFVIAYVNGSAPTYELHALDLNTLLDKVTPPVQVGASHKLSDGSTYVFNATVQRQRPGLLLVNGTVYAGFGGFCEFGGPSRGWLLGWKWNPSTPSLTPLGGQLNNRDVFCPSPFPCSPVHFFLTSIWMSGYGVAADRWGNLFFSTGNSAPSTWDGVNNIQESVVELSRDLKTILGIFSPNATFGTFAPDTLQLDKRDEDLGSGGVLVLPSLGGQFLAAAAGKDGRLFLFARNFPGKNSLSWLQTNPLSGCWCGPAYFVGSDGLGRVVTSHGSNLNTFQVNLTSPPSLSLEGTSISITSGQDAGFFTAVSCNTSGRAFGSCALGSAIIWAVSRPKPTSTNNFSTAVNLYAFSALPTKGKYPLLFSSASGPVPAGFWPNLGGNANIVPTISNGKVYVASNKQLTIFGVLGTPAPLNAQTAPPIASLTSTFSISGILQDVNGPSLTLKNRKGKNRQIDASQALNDDRVAAALIKGDTFTVVGSSFTPTGALLADAIYRAKGDTGDEWPPDKEPNQH